MKQIAEQVRVSQPPPNIGGRGAMFLRMQQAQAMSEAAERVITPQQPPVIGGRGAVLQKLQQATSEHPQPPISIGRGKVLQTSEYVIFCMNKSLIYPIISSTFLLCFILVVYTFNFRYYRRDSHY